MKGRTGKILPHLQLPAAFFHLLLSWAQLHLFKGCSTGTQVPRSHWHPGANGADESGRNFQAFGNSLCSHCCPKAMVKGKGAAKLICSGWY